MSKNPQILIVDDEPSARRTLKALLLREGADKEHPADKEQPYDLAFAENGPEALAKAAELTPDVILLDVMMPGMDGFEVCRRLRADPLLAEAPVIMVTALDDHDSLLQGIEAGADDFISKPFNRAELRARVRTITRLNRYRRLLSERARFEWVVQQADDGYLMLNDGDDLLYANPRARLYLGLSPDTSEPISETFVELAARQYRPEPREAWATWPARASVPRYLVRPESPTARTFWLQVDVLELPSGPDVGQVVHLRDVSAQMALRRDMRGFHALVTHKLRTPLISVSTGMELLSRHASRMSSAEIARFSTTALDGIKRLREEIEDILRYLHAPALVKPGAEFNLSQLPALVADIGAELELESVTVSGSRELANARILLSQRAVILALWEILENAKKFHPQQTPTVNILLSPTGSQEISIRISDDGLTLSPEQLAQVWTPYYQGEKDFTGETPGMGLGLPLVAATLWGVGGSCHIHNQKTGPGVVVELICPLSASSQGGTAE